jgi:glyoxylate/hydroxypyruvate reductase A
MVLLVKPFYRDAFDDYKRMFGELLPELEVRDWDDPDVDPAEVRYAMTWQPPAGRLPTYPNLRLVVSYAAGVDHILRAGDYPLQVPISRMVTPETGDRMADYVMMGTYALMRDLPQILEDQKQQQWNVSRIGRTVSETTVGILGLGNLGMAAATRLLANGFRVLGWGRTPKSHPNIHTFVGIGELDVFLQQSNILINLLPDTVETRGLLNAGAFAKLPAGAGFINVGRAGQVDTAALIDALNSKHLSGAVLDVFESEPLPQGHRLWMQPGIIVTSHLASVVSRASKAKKAAAAISADMQGREVPDLYDHARGY